MDTNRSERDEDWRELPSILGRSDFTAIDWDAYTPFTRDYITHISPLILGMQDTSDEANLTRYAPTELDKAPSDLPALLERMNGNYENTGSPRVLLDADEWLWNTKDGLGLFDAPQAEQRATPMIWEGERNASSCDVKRLLDPTPTMDQFSIIPLDEEQFNFARSSATFEVPVCGYNLPTTLQVASTPRDTPATRRCDMNAPIGSALLNGKFQCNEAECSGATFGRFMELKRHYEGAHAMVKPRFWCSNNMCKRSALIGIHPFPRKDKRDEHFRRMHGHL